MKVFDINIQEHTIILIPRFYPTSTINVNVYKEGSNTVYNKILSSEDYIINNGYLSFILSESMFIELLCNNCKYEIKITENDNVVYRGKAIATNQNTEDYKLTKDVYIYE